MDDVFVLTTLEGDPCIVLQSKGECHVWMLEEPDLVLVVGALADLVDWVVQLDFLGFTSDVFPGVVHVHVDVALLDLNVGGCVSVVVLITLVNKHISKVVLEFDVKLWTHNKSHIVQVQLLVWLDFDRSVTEFFACVLPDKWEVVFWDVRGRHLYWRNLLFNAWDRLIHAHKTIW